MQSNKQEGIRKNHFGSDPQDLTDVSGPEEKPVDKVFKDQELHNVVGMSTGEDEGETVAGGWEGTDDAFSTESEDLVNPRSVEAPEEMADATTGRGFGGGLAEEDGGVADINGSAVDGTRDWTNEPVIERKF
jgi:hypothetical protein